MRRARGYKRFQRGGYRIELGIGIFLVAAAATLVVGLATVATRTVRAALVNPTVSLSVE